MAHSIEEELHFREVGALERIARTLEFFAGMLKAVVFGIGTVAGFTLIRVLVS